MSMSRNPADTANESGATFASTFESERWQGPSFAASWISPPSPQRFSDEPSAPTRSDDHA
jgi:hypothetical protein